MKNSKPTQYENVNSLADQILTNIKNVLDEKLVGLYLFGSATTGDFDKDSSDIDLLAAIEEDLTQHEFDKLEKMHKSLELQYPEWKDRIEVIYISLHGLQSFKNERSKIAVINPGEPFSIRDAGKDWLINWYVVQETGIALFGPDQRIVIAHISKEEYRNDLKDHALVWRERIKKENAQSSPGGLAYAIFTMCRAMYRYEKGQQVSKKKAAEWVAKEFPQWATLLENAAVWRKKQWDQKQEPVGSYFPKVVEFVNFAIDQIISS